MKWWNKSWEFLKNDVHHDKTMAREVYLLDTEEKHASSIFPFHSFYYCVGFASEKYIFYALALHRSQ